MNEKGNHNEISYIGDGLNEDDGWLYYPGQFCLVNNASDVNSEWYDAYMGVELDSTYSVWNTTPHSGVPSIKIYEIAGKCYKKRTVTLTTPPSISGGSIDYNIIAHAVDFGFFNWDIDIKCFYATHSDPFKPASYEFTSEEEIKCSTEDDNIRVHASDPINLFPSSDGTDITDVSEAGREVGFNWSKYAINDKNPDYLSNPPKLMEKIQSIAKDGKTYSDEYLDYQFYMSPQNIRALRDANYHPFNDNDYQDPKDTYNGMVHYHSSLIRENKYFSNIVVPQGNAVYCNNIEKSAGSRDSNGCLVLE